MNLSALAARLAQMTPSKLYIIVPISIAGALYWFSSLPGTPLPGDPLFYVLYWIPPSVQNTLHIPAYAALAWTWHWALGAWLRGRIMQVIGALTIASAYGVFYEWH